MANSLPVVKQTTTTLTGAATSKVTNLSLSTINTEFAHALVNGLRELIIRNRDKASMKMAFVAAESATKYITLNAGAVLALDGLSFSATTIYLQSPKISTVEILELS